MIEYYLIFIWGDVEPHLHGPYRTEEERDQAAHELRKEEGDEHGYYPAQVTMVNGRPVLSIDAYSGAFFEQDDKTGEGP